MRHRRRHSIVAALGALSLAAPVATGIGVAAVPGIDVTVEGVEGTELVGTISCETPRAEVDLSTVLLQEAAPFDVQAYGGLDGTLDCGPEPVEFRIGLGADGVLVPGTAGYEVRLWTSSGPVLLVGEGDVALTDELNVTYDVPPDDDGYVVSIDATTAESESGPVATGTVTCDEPVKFDISLEGWQTAGRYHLSVDGEQWEVYCDGETPFAIPFSSQRGELAPGPATVTVTADTYEAASPIGRTTAVVTVTTGTPEPDYFRPNTNDDSPISFDGAFRDGGRLAAVVATAPCEPGRVSTVEATLRPAVVEVGDRWFEPFSFLAETTSTLPCTGAEQRHLVVVPEEYRGDEAVVEVEWREHDPAQPDATSPWFNQATLEVATK